VKHPIEHPGVRAKGPIAFVSVAGGEPDPATSPFRTFGTRQVKINANGRCQRRVLRSKSEAHKHSAYFLDIDRLDDVQA
jgi:hypothetical protein